MWEKLTDEQKNLGAGETILIISHRPDYTSDVYHSWWMPEENRWARWPHKFEPTHFIYIPDHFA